MCGPHSTLARWSRTTGATSASVLHVTQCLRCFLITLLGKTHSNTCSCQSRKLHLLRHVWKKKSKETDCGVLGHGAIGGDISTYMRSIFSVMTQKCQDTERDNWGSLSLYSQHETMLRNVDEFPPILLSLPKGRLLMDWMVWALSEVVSWRAGTPECPHSLEPSPEEEVLCCSWHLPLGTL